MLLYKHSWKITNCIYYSTFYESSTKTESSSSSDDVPFSLLPCWAEIKILKWKILALILVQIIHLVPGFGCLYTGNYRIYSTHLTVQFRLNIFRCLSMFSTFCIWLLLRLWLLFIYLWLVFKFRKSKRWFEFICYFAETTFISFFSSHWNQECQSIKCFVSDYCPFLTFDKFWSTEVLSRENNQKGRLGAQKVELKWRNLYITREIKDWLINGTY